MKVSAWIFLAGLALVYATPLQSSNNDLSDVDIFQQYAEEKLTLDEVKEKLKSQFDELIKKIKDAVDAGKDIKGDFLEKAKELQRKLKDLKINVDGKAKELFEKLREKAKDFFEKLLNKLDVTDKRTVQAHTEAILLQADESGDLGKELREKFDNLMKQIHDAFEQGNALKEALDRLEKIRESFKDTDIDLEEKGKGFFKNFKEKVVDYWQRLKQKLSSKRGADIDIFGMLKELKETIKSKFDAGKLKEYVEKLFGKGSELSNQLTSLLREKSEKSKQKILDWIDRVLGEKDLEKRSVSEIYKRVRDYFKDLNIELLEKFIKFGEWVKEKYAKALDKGKSKVENIKKIAKEFVRDTTQINKDIAAEALDFFKDYKDDLGTLYDDVKEKVRRIFKGN